MNEPVSRRAYDYTPNNVPQGYYIEQIKEYAHTPISADDSSIVSFATFDEFEYVCNVIAAREKIVRRARIAPALRVIGYNNRYHNMKTGNPDALYEMGDLVQECLSMGDGGVIPIASNSNGLFNGVHAHEYRINKNAIAIAQNDAHHAGVKVSELNLYNALEGLEVLVSNESMYMDAKNELYFDETLTKFSFIKRHLQARQSALLRLLR